MRQFVLDASVALAWLFRDEETPATMAIHALTDDHEIVVPPHWFAEVANGIRQGERRGRCTQDDVPGFLHILGLLDYRIDTIPPLAQFEVILPLARQHDLTVYDAAYLQCAVSNDLALATLDKQLVAVAQSQGIQILGESR